VSGDEHGLLMFIARVANGGPPFGVGTDFYETRFSAMPAPGRRTCTHCRC
jgi:hypothetical protein